MRPLSIREAPRLGGVGVLPPALRKSKLLVCQIKHVRVTKNQCRQADCNNYLQTLGKE